MTLNFNEKKMQLAGFEPMTIGLLVCSYINQFLQIDVPLSEFVTVGFCTSVLRVKDII